MKCTLLIVLQRIKRNRLSIQENLSLIPSDIKKYQETLKPLKNPEFYEDFLNLKQKSMLQDQSKDSNPLKIKEKTARFLKNKLTSQITLIKTQVLLRLRHLPSYTLYSTSYEIIKNTTIIEKHISQSSNNEEILSSYKIHSSNQHSTETGETFLKALSKNYTSIKSPVQSTKVTQDEVPFWLNKFRETVKQSLKIDSNLPKVLIVRRPLMLETFRRLKKLIPVGLVFLFIVFFRYKKMFI
jgi:hypothetical protein